MRLPALILALSLSSPALAANCPASAKLDGSFKANDKGSYMVRTVGTTVWWIGRSPDGGASWTNAFKGIRKGDMVTGTWADIGEGATATGTLTLRITANNQLQKLTGSGDGFGGSIWLRPGCTFSKAQPID